MKKNIVLIETEDSVGTGILYPCKYRGEISDYQSFIIFTNRHVLSGLGKKNKPHDDIKDFIILQFYDDGGNRIKREDIKKVLVHNTCRDINNYNDIAALLVCIDKKIILNVDTRIHQEELRNREILFTEGYPGVMLNDEVSQKVQLQGLAKDIFPINNKVGMYQIKDDYHWYNSIKDYRLLQGFSGSPVYIEKDNQAYLVGMNQSVSDIADGENPFKLVYYLKIKHVIERLRETGCLIFRKERDGSYQLEWVYGLEDKIKDWDNNPVFFLIGGSGAGKSSFAKDFAYHGDLLNVTNDGQTTRTSILYEYSLFCENPKVEVNIYKKDDFIKRMSNLNRVKAFDFLFERVFQLSPRKSVNDELYYLRNCYYLIDRLKQKRKDLMNELDEILISSNNKEYDVDNLIMVYQKIMLNLLEAVPVFLVKYICDKQIINEIKQEYQDAIDAKKFQTFNGQAVAEKRYILESIINRKWSDFEAVQRKFGFIIDNMFDYCDTDKSYRTFQRICGREIKNNRNNKKRVDLFNDNKSIVSEQATDLGFKEEFFDKLFHIEGFFNLSEFSWLHSFEAVKHEICKNNDFIEFGLEIQEFEKEDIVRRNKIEINESVEKIYGIVYDEIIKALEDKKLLKPFEKRRFEISLINMNKEKQNLLTYCLQMRSGKSLTGIIKSVNISDRISNEYAMLISEMKIKSLRLLDTCGLDHVENNRSIGDVLREIVDEFIDDENIKYEDVSVLYLKKLDSGRPDELRVLLPEVYASIPRAPIYCMFTGIDIYYQGDTEDVRRIYWRKETNNSPKAVKYILSEKGRNELIDEVKGSEERRDNMYIVLKNNLIPYCGQKNLVAADYNFYENNIKYIRSLLISILRKEYSSLAIVDIEKAKKVVRENRQVVEDLIGKVFEKASVHTWRYYATVKANYRDISADGEMKYLGFSRALKQQWNQLFYNAYTEVITKESQTFVNIFPKSKSAIEAALANMTMSYLGPKKNLFNGELIESEKNEFRRTLERMYKSELDGRRIYTYDPFTTSEAEREIIGKNYYKMKAYLLDVVNFSKGYSGSKVIRDQFVDFFVDTFLNQLKKDNVVKVKSLVEIQPRAHEVLVELEKEFIERYSLENNIDSETSKQMFRNLMRNYFME